MDATTARRRSPRTIAEEKLDEPLVDWITSRRNGPPKQSWRAIARELATITDGEVDVTGEAVRTWSLEAAS